LLIRAETSTVWLFELGLPCSTGCRGDSGLACFFTTTRSLEN
jgi:hypothetical protein